MAPREAEAVPGQGPALIPRPLPRRFFARPSTEVARDLLGRDLVRRTPRGLLVARLVETEAYQQDDPASHSFRGPSARTEVMFGPPGHLYVYFIYGMHFCMNVVTGRAGEGSAVLLRAAEPLEGLPAMAGARGTQAVRLLCAGPARLAQAFGVGRIANGTDLVAGGELFVSRGEPVGEDAVEATPRIGIRVATERPWRYVVAGSPYASRLRPVGSPRS